ncbi:MAG TPA: hypothetical protein VFY66_14280 [Anaerolineales bacterium]|nr:hypothetical protein [Anaerolineales bacterium]
MKKRTLLVIFGVAIGTWGCSFSAGTIATPTQTQVDEVGTLVAATMQAYTASPTESISTQATESPAATQTGGTPISAEGVSFVIPSGVASGANAEKMTAVESNSGAPWDIAPTHLRFTLTEYTLQSKFHEPRLFVYPVEEYTQSNSNAAEQIDRLKKILAGGTPLQETLPSVPFFNAAAQIAASIKVMPFQNGSGVRSLTQYAQYAAPINNHELFYHFQGLSSDGKYYVLAILPISAPILPEDEKPDATIPEGGVPIPTDIGPNDVYYFSVTEKLNSVSPDAFTPSLDELDALIQSILLASS